MAWSYRYGFNGQEKSDEIKGEGNSYTAEFWEYDPRIARRWNLDPVPQISFSDYSVLFNNPVNNVDPNGAYSWFGATWRAAKWGGRAVYSEKRKNYGVEYGGRPFGEKGHEVIMQFEGKRQLFGKEEAERLYAEVEDAQFWKKEIELGHVTVTQDRVSAFASYMNLALPGGKLLMPVSYSVC